MTGIRYWMNLLCESSDRDLVAAIQRVMQERGLYIGDERNPDGLPDDEIIMELVYDAERLIDQRGPVVTVYRAISLPDLAQLRTHSLGQSWSLEDEMALPYQGDMDRFYRITGRVPADHIDRRASIIMQVAYEEGEVVLMAGSPITIAAITSVTPEHHQPVASPLVGQTLRA